jgi:small nuclear ribonucleoprotein (snRNP)-like protein
VKRIIRNHLRHRVVVTLKDGSAFSGVLYQADSEAWLLREAQLDAGPKREPVGVDGELLILRPDVAYLQIP